MPETLHRIAYDATIDDAVDVAFRLAARSETFRKQVRLNIIVAGVLGGLGFLGVWWYYVSAPSGLGLAMAAFGSVVFGVMFAFIFRYFFTKEMHKQHRKMAVEHFGGKPTMRSELELRSDAIWVRQAGMELIFPWTLCTGIQDNPGDVQVDFSAGICVVRNRDFPSTAERQTFLETARRLASLQEAR